MVKKKLNPAIYAAAAGIVKSADRRRLREDRDSFISYLRAARDLSIRYRSMELRKLNSARLN